MKNTFILLLLVLLFFVPFLHSQEVEEKPFYERLFDTGKSHYSKGDYSEAIRNFKIAYFGFFENLSKLTECYVYLAVCHSLLDNPEQAQHFIDEIDKLNLQPYVTSIQQPENLVSRYNELTSKQQVSKITPEKKSKIKQDPETTPPKPQTVPPPPKKEKTLDREKEFERVEKLIQRKKIEEAKTKLADMLVEFPESIQVYTSLGVIYVNELEFQKAIQILEQAKSIENKNIEVCYFLGVANMAVKNYQKAADEFKIVMNQDPLYKSVPTLYEICLEKIKE